MIPAMWSLSYIIIDTDNVSLNEKRCELNLHGQEMIKEENLYLINYSKKINQVTLTKVNFTLTKMGQKSQVMCF